MITFPELPGVDINILLLVFVGFGAGILSGFAGVGGAFIVTPALIILGFPANFAVGTGLAWVMGSSIVGAFRHRKLGNVDVKLGLVILVAAMGGMEVGVRILNLTRDAGLVDEMSIREHREYLLQFIRLLKERVTRITDFAELGKYFFIDPVQYEDKIVKKYWMKAGAKDRFICLTDRLNTADTWTEETLEKVIRGLAEEEGVGAGFYIHPTRLAITGSGASPGLFELMAILGRETVIRRMRSAISYMSNIFKQK